MFGRLKDHPFAVEAFFESSHVLTFALPKEQLEPFIPPCLKLDTHNDKWAFIAVALVQTKNLRPKGFPEFLGNDFFLIGYRIFVQYTTLEGKRLRGLYILKSETDRRKMEWLGNIFTQYSYTTTDIKVHSDGSETLIKSDKSNIHIRIDDSQLDVQLPPSSPFRSWKEARRFAGPLPFTFTHNAIDQSMLIVEGVRQNWQPTPVHISKYEIGFLDEMNLTNAVLANAFVVNQIPYCWKKGRIEML